MEITTFPKNQFLLSHDDHFYPRVDCTIILYKYMRHRPWPSFPSKGSRPLKAGRHFCIKEDVPHFFSWWALAQ